MPLSGEGPSVICPRVLCLLLDFNVGCSGPEPLSGSFSCGTVLWDGSVFRNRTEVVFYRTNH